MNPRRQKAQDTVIKYLTKLFNNPDNENVKLYKELFKTLSDGEFDQLMKDIRDGKTRLSVVCPIGDKMNLSVKSNMRLAKELGYDFLQRLVYAPTKDLPGYTTPNKYMVVRFPIRRVSQTLVKKISVPDHNKSVSAITGQVTNDSRSSTMTFPEINVLSGYGAFNILKEILKVRGGDLGSMNAFERSLQQTGSATLEQLEQYATGTLSNRVLSRYLLGMMIRSTIYKD